ILSRILPAVSSMHSGRYDEGASGGLPGFDSSTSLCLFHGLGKTPPLRHAEYTLRKASGRKTTASLRALFGTPSGPGAAPSRILVQAPRSSSRVTPGITAPAGPAGGRITPRSLSGIERRPSDAPVLAHVEASPWGLSGAT
ncbi:unnamed protein product, partial [Trichogramma brassicae]